MNPGNLKNTLLQKLQRKDHSGIKGGKVSFHIPIQESLLNVILAASISSSEGLKDFRSIHFSDLNDEEFVVRVDHRKINKTIRCQLHNISYNKDAEPLLRIEFVEGIRFYEKIALLSATTFQKGMKWFKSQFQDEEEENKKSKSAVDISTSLLTINLAQLLRQQDLDYLNPLITWKEVSARENTLIIDFNINT